MLTIPTGKLVDSLDAAYRAVPRSRATPELHQFKLVHEGDRLEVWGNNLTTGIIASCPASGSLPAVTVEARTLRSLAKRARTGMVKLGMGSPNTLSVESGQISATLPIGGAETYPRIKRPSKWIDTGIGQFKDALKSVVFAVNPDTPEPMLSGMHIKTTDGCLELAGTDKYRLSVKRIPIKGSLPIETAIIPHETIKLLIRLSSDELYVAMVENALAFKSGNILASTQLINQQYPPYERFYREEWKTRIVVSPTELKHGVRAANVMTQYHGDTLEVDVTDDVMLLTGRTMEQGTSQARVPVEKQGEDIHFMANGQHLEDIASACSVEAVAIELESPVKPIFYKPVGDDSHWMLSMPMADTR